MYKIAIIGLGYVGLPLLNEFSKHFDTIGYDIDKSRVKELENNFDRTLEISKNNLKKSKAKFTCNQNDLSGYKIFIITVPTPITTKNLPNLRYIKEASKTVAKYISNGSIIVYESTVYPGATEEVFIPLVSKHSGLIPNKDFFYGYSPERINPGDKKHTISKIIKVVSGSNKKTMLTLRTIYSKIIQAGIYLAPSIKVAEAAKVIENTQRDLNIAFVNELSIIFNKLKIDTSEVLKAAETKWNFHNYKPGLVGGHCIGVDPYYLTYKSKKIGINPKVILAGRVINNSIPNFIINEIENKLKKKGKNLLNLKTLIFGLTFKNDCPDTRNSQVFKIINLLLKKNNKIDVYDPWVKNNNNYKKFNLVSELKVKSQYDIIIIAVNHHQFKKLGIKKIRSLMKKNGILFDVKNIFNKKESDLSL